MTLVQETPVIRLQQKLLTTFITSRQPHAPTVPSLLRFVCAMGEKWSYRKTVLIHLLSALRRFHHLNLAKHPDVKAALKRIDLLLVREAADKAPLLTDSQLDALVHCPVREFAVPLALMLPAGARFADVQKIRAGDVCAIESSGRVTLRIFQAKNIRRRKNQRWYVMMVPRPLLPHLYHQWLTVPQQSPLVQVTYSAFMRFLKRYLRNQSVSTYSIRRSVFERLRRRVRNIEDMTKVTMHRDPDQLRWYLEAPLPDEAAIQTYATAWHSGSSY
eukprot:PhM_4_TR18715/c1_g4_i2/m.62389